MKYLLILSLSLTLAHGAGPGISNDFGGKRVLIIGIDGCRSDALRLADAPNIHDLVTHGVTTWTGTAGGELGGITQQPTISGPGWTSMMTGKYLNIHGVSGNGTAAYDTADGYQLSQAPHFARRLKESVPTASFSSVASWSWIEDYLVAAQPSYFGYHTKGIGSSYPVRDLDVKNKVVAHLGSANPDVLFVHFDQVDGAGHSSGFRVSNPDYMNALHTVDSHVGEIVTALKNRPQYAQEDWLIIISTDHGGTNNGGHGGQSAEERTIPIILSGKDFDQNLVDPTTVGHHAIPAIAFKHLGVSVSPSWGWEPGVFGFAPYLKGESGGHAVHLSWQMPQAGLAGLTGIEVRRNGNLLASLPAGATEYTEFPAPAAGIAANYEVTYVGSGEVRTVSVTPPTELTSELVLDLPFEGNGNDISGRGNHATAVGGSYVGDGKSGQAAVLNSTSSFSLGQPTDLKFGTSTDFTVSFWFRDPTDWSGDPSIISNKNWSSGGNTGWIIAGQSGSRSWQWNFKGASLLRMDYDPSDTVSGFSDGEWHLVTVTHKRDGNATFYHDGSQIGTVPINGAGNVDTTNNIRIGRDGNNAFAFNVNVNIDDLKIWRRALAAAEVAAMAQKTSAYTAWTQTRFDSGEQNDPMISGAMADPDHDGIRNLIEFAIGTSPKQPETGVVLSVTQKANGLELSWPQWNGGYGVNGTNYTAAGVRYRIESSLTMASGSWESAAPYLTEVDAPVFLGNGMHMPRLRMNPGAEKRFYRLVAEVP